MCVFGSAAAVCENGLVAYWADVRNKALELKNGLFALPGFLQCRANALE